MLFNSFVFLFAVPPGHVRRLLDAAASAQTRYVWLDAHRLRLLRLLGRAVLSPDGVLDARQLPGRPGVSPVERPAPPQALSRRADHGRPLAARLLQVRRLRPRYRSRRWCTGWAPTSSLPHLNIILPIGISFYTFHTISYIVDSYRGVIRRRATSSSSAAYVSLFSQLVAGPIVRFRQIEDDLESLGEAQPDALARIAASRSSSSAWSRRCSWRTRWPRSSIPPWPPTPR